MKIYIPVYDFGWRIRELEPFSVRRFTKYSVCIDGIVYPDDVIMRSREAAMRYIQREYVPDAERVTVEEMLSA